MYYYDYWITNTKTGRHYIGSKADHKIPVSGYGGSFSKEESSYPLKNGSCKNLKKDIKKYGVEHFYKHILEEFSTEKQCRASEGKWHDLYEVGVSSLFLNEIKAGKGGFSNSGKFHHGFSDNDWEGMSMRDPRGYAKVRRLLDKELESDPISELTGAEWINTNVLTPEEEFDNENIDSIVDSILEAFKIMPKVFKSITAKEKFERNKIIFIQYFLDVQNRSFECVGQEHDITRVSARQIVNKQLRRLRHPYFEEKFRLRERWENYMLMQDSADLS